MSPFSALPPSMGIIVVRDDGSGSTTSTGVSNTQGSAPAGRSNNNHFVTDFINLFLRNQWLQILMIWMNIIQKIRNGTLHVIDEVTPTMGLALLAVGIQNIYEVKYAQGIALKQNLIQKMNGIAVLLLLFGLFMPRHAGGRIALTGGVLLMSGTAISLAFI
ncbi:uncharacterized protein LOC141644050 isoform X2 [Silene latifolia]|uniref:uncharacterized protein LOC141644050 isoform X2 n=1 Tax=Silene latifolia TaxID=37657 RepID=UPI003D78871C